jgi:CBS domain-containing protein
MSRVVEAAADRTPASEEGAARGLKRGFEGVLKVALPLLFVILIVLMVRALTLPGGEAGLAHLFTVKPAEFANPQVWIQAFTQVAGFHAGPIGAGHSLKLINNVLSLGTTALVVEAVAEESVERSEAERAQLNAAKSPLREDPLRLERRPSPSAPGRNQESNRLVPEAPELVRDHLTSTATFADADWDLEEAADAMARGGFRHLVVVDNGEVELVQAAGLGEEGP